MNDAYGIVQDLIEVKYTILLLVGAPRSWHNDAKEAELFKKWMITLKTMLFV